MELIATIKLAKDKIVLKLLEKYDIIYHINSQYKFSRQREGEIP